MMLRGWVQFSLNSGAWWPGGRSSSWVSQFLPSGCGSAYQMAAEWIDSFQGDLSPWWFWQLCFCSVWCRCPAERGEQTQRYAQLSAQLSAGPCNLGWSCFHTTLRCTESVHFLYICTEHICSLIEPLWLCYTACFWFNKKNQFKRVVCSWFTHHTVFSVCFWFTKKKKI